MSRKQLVKDLAEAMREKDVGFRGNVNFKSPLHFDYEEELREENYHYLEENNLSQIIEVVNQSSNGIEYSELYKKFGIIGLLKVQPRYVNSYPPCLMFRKDAFLSWFRGYCFQVSGNPDGDGDYGRSETTLQRDVVVAKYLPEELQPLIALSHVCEATTKFEEFNEIIWNKVELINKFMLNTSKTERILAKKFDINNIKLLFKQVDELPAQVGKTISLCEVGRKGASDTIFGVMAFGETFIGIRQFKNDKWTVIEFPKYTGKAVVYNTDSEVSREEYYQVVWTRFAHVLASYESIRLDFLHAYSIDKKNNVSVSVSGVVANNHGISIINTKIIRNAAQLVEHLKKEVESLIESKDEKFMRVYADKIASRESGKMNLF